MSGGGETLPGAPDPELDVAPEIFLSRMEPYERVLVELKEKLYEGSWDRVLADLRARKDGKPFLYKLSQTLARDMAAIERMRAYELRKGVELSKLLRQSGSGETGKTGAA